MYSSQVPLLQAVVGEITSAIAAGSAAVPGVVVEQVNLRLPDGSAVVLFWDVNAIPDPDGGPPTPDWKITSS
jgi:hypothetical protein